MYGGRACGLRIQAHRRRLRLDGAEAQVLLISVRNTMSDTLRSYRLFDANRCSFELFASRVTYLVEKTAANSHVPVNQMRLTLLSVDVRQCSKWLILLCA